jgi:hypothetical protein
LGDGSHLNVCGAALNRRSGGRATRVAWLQSVAPHIHVDRAEYSAKFWLEPVALARNLGFRAQELRDVERLISDRRSFLLEAWHGYHGNPS